MNEHDDNADGLVIRLGDVKPGEPRRVYATDLGLVVNDHDGITVHRKDGSILTLHVDGSSEVQNPVVKRIEIDNALLIKDYRISPALGAQSHVISFEGGGVFSYLRGRTGEVIEIRLSDGAYCRCDCEGNLIVFASAPADVVAREERP